MIDVLVVGGGPAGAAAAASACAEGMDVELVCAGPGGRPAPGESLPPGTDVVLHDTFGASPLNREQHRLSFGNRSAWGASRLDATDFMRNPFGEGWHLDRQSFDSSLVNRVRVQGVQVRADARVVRPSLERRPLAGHGRWLPRGGNPRAGDRGRIRPGRAGCPVAGRAAAPA